MQGCEGRGKSGNGKGHTRGDPSAALLNNAAGGGGGQGAHVRAHAGVVGGRATGSTADGIEDAAQGALGEDGDVLRRGDGGQGGNDDG